MNRRGHIGTILLVLGALILVTSALYSFYSFGNKIKFKDAEFKGLSLEAKQSDYLIKEGVNKVVLDSILSSKDSPNFEQSFNKSIKLLSGAERINSVYPDNNVFAKLANFDYSLLNDDSEYTLKVKGLFYKIKSRDGLNIISRDFDLKVRFTNEKVLSIEYE